MIEFEIYLKDSCLHVLPGCLKLSRPTPNKLTNGTQKEILISSCVAQYEIGGGGRGERGKRS